MKWLLLRGLVREQRHWAEFPKVLKQHLRVQDPEAQVFALDLPGFGTEHQRASPSSVSQMVDDLRERWLKLSNASETEAWILISISLGGMIALDWTARFPDDFKKLILINSSLADESPFHHRLKPKNYLSIVKMIIESNSLKREEKILSLTSTLSSEKLKARAKLQNDFSYPIRKRDALNQLWAAARFRSPAKIGIPLLVLASEKDHFVDSSCSKKIAKKYGAPLHLHPTANHDLSLDDPEWLSHQIVTWTKT